jgi:16S rRNA (uracil1498-N3)-methyltransferase
MRLHRFYITETLRSDEVIRLADPRLLHQWRTVFRFRAGQEITLFNGNGFEFHAVIEAVHKEGAEVKVGEKKLAYIPERKLTLCLALIKKDLFELVCEKATELGVSSIIPIITERSLEKNLNMDRLQKIVIEAAEQCGRVDVPAIGETQNLAGALASADGEVVVADMGGVSVEGVSSASSFLFIGPEGGWGEKDQELFAASNIKKVSLSETVLRAETAAIVGTAFLMK